MDKTQIKKAVVCPRCQQTDSIIKNAIRNDHQRYKCKSCGKTFQEETNDGAIKRLAKSFSPMKTTILPCPYCNSSDQAIKHGFRHVKYSRKNEQTYLCKKCTRYYSNKTVKKKNEESYILNSYLGCIDRDNPCHFDEWYKGKIAKHIGVSRQRLLRIIKKHDSLVKGRSGCGKENAQ